MFDSILITTDGSEPAERAAPYAVELADTFDATLYVIYVVDMDAVSQTVGGHQVERLFRGELEEIPKIHEAAAEAIDRIREYTTGVEIDTEPVIEIGVPHEAIEEFANDHGVDLIVMASEGRGGIRRALLGSVTERVARSTTIPVLIVDRQDIVPHLMT